MSALVPRNGVSPISLGISLLPQRNRTLAEYAPIFLQHLEFVRQRRANTVLGYGADLKTFLRFCEQADLSQPDEVTFRHSSSIWAGCRRSAASRPRAPTDTGTRCARSGSGWCARRSP